MAPRPPRGLTDPYRQAKDMTHPQQVHVGIDLAWSTVTTGLAAVAGSGRLLTSTSVQDDDEIADWIEQLPRPPRVVAVDAPLIVPNATDQRSAERLIGQAFGHYGASAHSANRTLLRGEPRGTRLARRFGWTVDPHAPPSDDRTVCIEVYPHPALIGLFRLPYRLAYKRKSPSSIGCWGSVSSPTCWSPSLNSTWPLLLAEPRSASPWLRHDPETSTGTKTRSTPSSVRTWPGSGRTDPTPCTSTAASTRATSWPHHHPPTRL